MGGQPMSDKDAEDASDMSDIVERLREMATGPVSHRPITAGRLCKEATAEIERLRAALTECSTPYDSGPTTVLDGARLVAAEFQRRMDIAGSALSPLPAKKG